MKRDEWSFSFLVVSTALMMDESSRQNHQNPERADLSLTTSRNWCNAARMSRQPCQEGLL